jgi:hypothetical protein
MREALAARSKVDKSDDLVPYVAWTIARQLSYTQAVVWKKPVGKRLEALLQRRGGDFASWMQTTGREWI